MKIKNFDAALKLQQQALLQEDSNTTNQSNSTIKYQNSPKITTKDKSSKSKSSSKKIANLDNGSPVFSSKQAKKKNSLAAKQSSKNTSSKVMTKNCKPFTSTCDVKQFSSLSPRSKQKPGVIGKKSGGGQSTQETSQISDQHSLRDVDPKPLKMLTNSNNLKTAPSLKQKVTVSYFKKHCLNNQLRSSTKGKGGSFLEQANLIKIDDDELQLAMAPVTARDNYKYSSFAPSPKCHQFGQLIATERTSTSNLNANNRLRCATPLESQACLSARSRETVDDIRSATSARVTSIRARHLQTQKALIDRFQLLKSSARNTLTSIQATQQATDGKTGTDGINNPLVRFEQMLESIQNQQTNLQHELAETRSQIATGNHMIEDQQKRMASCRHETSPLIQFPNIEQKPMQLQNIHAGGIQTNRNHQSKKIKFFGDTFKHNFKNLKIETSPQKMRERSNTSPSCKTPPSQISSSRSEYSLGVDESGAAINPNNDSKQNATNTMLSSIMNDQTNLINGHANFSQDQTNSFLAAQKNELKRKQSNKVIKEYIQHLSQDKSNENKSRSNENKQKEDELFLLKQQVQEIQEKLAFMQQSQNQFSDQQKFDITGQQQVLQQVLGNLDQQMNKKSFPSSKRSSFVANSARKPQGPVCAQVLAQALTHSRRPSRCLKTLAGDQNVANVSSLDFSREVKKSSKNENLRALEKDIKKLKLILNSDLYKQKLLEAGEQPPNISKMSSISHNISQNGIITSSPSFINTKCCGMVDFGKKDQQKKTETSKNTTKPKNVDSINTATQQKQPEKQCTIF